MRRRNAIPVGRQPTLFGGEDAPIFIDWRHATPFELLQAAEEGALPKSDLEEMKDLVYDCQEEDSIERLLDEGVSVPLANALMQGLCEELEGFSVSALRSFMDDGGSPEDLHRFRDLYSDRGFVVNPWHEGPVYRWAAAIIPTFNEDGEHVGEAMHLVTWDVKKEHVTVDLATKVMDEVDMGFTDPEDYIDASWEMATFWDSPNTLYHATQPENVESILKSGLGMKNKSRGLRNRSVSAAVFTTLSEDRATDGMYGEAVFVIDTAAMKVAGVTPRVTQEPDVLEAEAANSLASALGLEDYHHEAENDPETVIVHGHIPARFLRLLEG